MHEKEVKLNILSVLVKYRQLLDPRAQMLKPTTA